MLRRAAPRIKAEGKALDLTCGSKWYKELDLDLADLAVELGVSVDMLGGNLRIDLKKWAEPKHHGAERPRDFVHLMTDDVIAGMVEAVLEGVMGDPQFEETAHGKKALLEARRGWFTTRLDRLAGEGLYGASQILEAELGGCVSAGAMRDMPDVYQRLKDVSLLPALGRTVRAGIPAELHWPAFEDALKRLGSKDNVLFEGSYPQLILYNQRKIVVVGPDSVLLEHDVKKPVKDAEISRVFYAGGQLFVQFGYTRKAYWSASPSNVFDFEGNYWFYGNVASFSYTLPDGGVSLGAAAIYPGDKKAESGAVLLSDGRDVWRLQWVNTEYKLIEYDPKTDKTGRASMPTWFEQTAEAGWSALINTYALFPMNVGDEGWCGAKDGIFGLAIRYNKESDQCRVDRFDGSRWQGRLVRGMTPCGAVRFPGADSLCPLSEEYQVGFVFYSPDGQARTSMIHTKNPLRNPYASWNERAPLPVTCLPALRPHSEVDSKLLRVMTDEALQPALEAARRVRAGLKEEQAYDHKQYEEVQTALAQALPALKDKHVKRALLDVIIGAASSHQALAELIEQADPNNAAMHSEAKLNRQALRSAFNALTGRHHYGHHQESPTLDRAIFEIDRFLVSGEAVRDDAGVRTLVTEVLTWLKALVWFTSRVGQLGHRPLCADLLDLLANTSLLKEPSRYRLLVCRGRREDLDINEEEFEVQIEHDTNRYYGFFERDSWRSQDGTFTLIERAGDDGVFHVPPKLTIEREQPLDGMLPSSEQAIAFSETLRSLPTELEWDPALATELATLTGMTSDEATILLAGLPNIRSYTTNFLPKDLRAALKIKAKDADIARKVFRDLDADKLRAILTGALPNHASQLLDLNAPGPDGAPSALHQLAQSWGRVVVREIKLDEHFVALIHNKLNIYNPKPLLMALLDPNPSPAFKAPSLNAAINAKKSDDDGEDDATLSFYTLGQFARLAPLLVATLPPSDPLRRALPNAYAQIIKTLSDKDTTMLAWSNYYWREEGQTVNTALLDALTAVGGERIESPLQRADNGALLALQVLANDSRLHFFIRPARLTSTRDEPNITRHVGEDYGWYNNTTEGLRSLDIVRSEAFAQTIARATETPIADDGSELDPRQSVPELVATVAETLSLDEAAASLYLCLLAWPDPREKELRDVLGLNLKQYRAAVAQLVAQDLILEAKRDRAGRAIFLPGIWLVQRQGVSIEEWKVKHTHVFITADGKVQGPVTWRSAPHQVFQTAWDRIQAGDKPSL
jgi:hypothetical protein